MKYRLLAITLVAVAAAASVTHAASTDTQPSVTKPIDIVRQRMNALNEHNFDAFMALYSDEIKVYVYPDTLLGEGKGHIKKIFGPMMRVGGIEVEIHQLLEADGYVVCRVTTSYRDKSEPSIAIYEVRDGLIQSVRFLRDNIRNERNQRKTKSD